MTENTLFTQDEQKQIAEQLRGLAKHVSDASSLSEAQKQILKEKIDYLVDGSRRLGRNDRLNTFIGVTLGYLLPPWEAPKTNVHTKATFQIL